METKTVRDIICEFVLPISQGRLNRLEELGAPNIVLSPERDRVNACVTRTLKINGSHKHKDLMGLEVSSVIQQEGNASYFRHHSKTVILTMTTPAGEVFYDWYDNKVTNSRGDLAPFKPYK